MNLFRGEILQKSLHYYFLAPVRREVLLAGKFLSGLAATATVFVASTLFQLLALFWHLDGNALHQYLYQSGGLGHVLAYMSISALACVGYGSVFSRWVCSSEIPSFPPPESFCGKRSPLFCLPPCRS